MDHKSRRHMPHVVFPLFVSHFSHRAIGIKQQGTGKEKKTVLTGLGRGMVGGDTTISIPRNRGTHSLGI